MEKRILEEERAYLGQVNGQIDKNKAQNSKKIKENKERIQEFKHYFADNYYDIQAGKGNDEFADINTSIENLEQQNIALEFQNTRLTKQKKNAYFGRFDFQSKTESAPNQYYIGLGLVQDKEGKNLVYDWRADVCSLYYDDKTGKSSYKCPDGEISGNVSLKRQYKIEKEELKYYLDSQLVIDDDILMEQLSKNTTSKMHEIVSTIQKEQNILIRDDNFSNTIVQGVAGSGKTSIAMHRVSFLLYKYRKELKSEDILVLSPSELFADYINEVLPALGEERSFTTTFAEMAKRLLAMPFEARESMLARVISKQEQKDFEEIAIKSSFEFLKDLQNFLNRDMCNLFIPKSLVFGDLVVEREEVKDIFFNRLKNVPIHTRIDVLAETIVDRFHVPEPFRDDLTKRAKKILYGKFLTTDIIRIYNIFLRSVGLEEIETIGAYDIAPVLLVKENLFGLPKSFDAKYVIVDEMQDYTPCHFYLFDKIWSCPKLYLGDVYQSIDRTLPPNYLKNLGRLTHSEIKYLSKSYRSTLQISLFAQKILGKHIADNVNRNGEDVECVTSKNCAHTIEKILEHRAQSPKTKTQSIAIICKTKDQIKELQKESDIIKKFKLLDNTRSMTNTKHIITTPAEAKGVEFDCVIIPFATDKVYNNELDQNLLYVSSTRALHKLYFVSNGKASRYLVKHQK